MKAFITSLLFLFLCQGIFAQMKIIRGTITNSEKQPLSGVIVSIKDPQISVLTDDKGKYEIQIPDSVKTLIYSKSGFHTIKMSISSQSEIDLMMGNVDVFELSLEELLQIKVNVSSKLEGLTQKDIPAQTTIISRDEIQLTGARNLPELISLIVPGAMAVFDADDYIFGFRGFAPDNNSMVKILVNGQDVGFTANQNSSTMMALLDLNFIEQLEVITGPGSSVFGSGPLLGVINIITTKFNPNDKKTEATAGVKYGSGKYQDIYGHIRSVSENNLRIAVDYSFFSQKDGYKPKSGTSDWIIPAQVIKDGKYHESHPGFSLFSVIEKNETQLSFYATKFVWDNYNTSDPAQVKDMRTMGAKLATKFKFAEGWDFQPSIFVKNVYLQCAVSDVNNLQSADYGDELNYGSELKVSYNGDKLKAAFGGIYNRHQYGYNTFGGKNVYYVKSGTAVFDQKGNSVSHGDYVQMAEKVIVDNIDIYAEARYQLTPIHAVHLSALMSYDSEMDETDFGPKIAYLGKVDNFWWKAIYTHAFRTPISMAIGNMPAGGFYRYYVNPDLKTQTVEDAEVHFGYTQRDLAIQLVTFYNNNKGIILAGSFPQLATGFDPAKWGWTFANGGNIQTYGAEFTTEWKPINTFSLRLSHSFVKIASVSFENSLTGELYADFDGKHMFSYPENITKLNVTYSLFANLKLRADAIIDYGRYRSGIKSRATDGTITYTGLKTKSENWYNINLGGIYTVAKQWQVSANVYNVLDSRPYQNVVHTTTTASTPYPRSFILGLAYTFSN